MNIDNGDWSTTLYILGDNVGRDSLQHFPNSRINYITTEERIAFCGTGSQRRLYDSRVFDSRMYHNGFSCSPTGAQYRQNLASVPSIIIEMVIATNAHPNFGRAQLIEVRKGYAR